MKSIWFYEKSDFFMFLSFRWRYSVIFSTSLLLKLIMNSLISLLLAIFIVILEKICLFRALIEAHQYEFYLFILFASRFAIQKVVFTSNFLWIIDFT